MKQQQQKQMLAVNRLKLHALKLWNEIADSGKHAPAMEATQEYQDALSSVIVLNDMLDRLMRSVAKSIEEETKPGHE